MWEDFREKFCEKTFERIRYFWSYFYKNWIPRQLGKFPEPMFLKQYNDTEIKQYRALVISLKIDEGRKPKTKLY